MREKRLLLILGVVGLLVASTIAPASASTTAPASGGTPAPTTAGKESLCIAVDDETGKVYIGFWFC